MSDAAEAVDPTQTSPSQLEREDLEARSRALDPERSIILQAPAGSGKTTVLTHRFLRLLAVVDEPEEILAVTFTRKAAGEMRSRIAGALAGGIGGEGIARETAQLAAEARARSRARGWDLDANPGRLRIQTLDALQRALAAQLPVAARATIGLALTDHPATLYRRAARRTLTDAEGSATLRVHFERLLERLDMSAARLERLLMTMLHVRAQWLPLVLRESADELPDAVIASLRSIIADRLRAAAALFPRSLIERGMALRRTAARNLGNPVAQPQDGRVTLDDWRALAAIALTESGEWRSSLSKRQGFPADDPVVKARAQQWVAEAARVRGAREMLTELASLPDASLEHADAAALVALGRILRLAASELELVFAEDGAVDYSYVAAAARRALTEEGAPTDLSLRLGQRLRHILVDEFQDTSSSQVQLLRALTAGWQPGDGRSLFLVGDPMQSIYLFREAEVGLFLQAWQDGLGDLPLEPLRLTRNFRAHPELVGWFNATFSRVFPERADIRSSAVSYAPSVAARSAPGGRAELHRTPPGAGHEALSVLEIVRRARAETPDATVAVLVAARSHATPVVLALREAGVPVTGIDLVPLAEVPIVRDLAALARAIDHLSDRTAWLAVLRAPWCGLELRDLTSLLAGAENATLWELMNDVERVARLSASGQVRLERTRAALGGALSRMRIASQARVLEEAWLRLGGPAAYRSETQLAHAERFFERFAAWSARPDWSTTEHLDERLATLFANETAQSGAVQVMTIHHAKGLEFDVVIVPSLARPARSDEEPLLRWLELPSQGGGLDLLVAPITPRGARGAEPLNRYLRSLQARRLAHERGRLLYVAATRARRELHLLCEVPDGAAPRPRSGTLLATLWPAVGQQLNAALPERLRIAPLERPLLTALERLDERWQLPAIERPRADAPFRIDEQPAPLPEFAWATDAARAVGRVVHEVLRELGSARRLPSRPEILVRRAAIGARLARLGLHAQARERAEDRVIDALLACAEDARARWLWAPEHREVATPLELTGILDGRLIEASVDRAFVDAAATRWLVDFKLGSHGEGGRDEFIARELERYRPQLERAATLAAGLGPEPVRAALYFPLMRAWVEL
jgi:ATP-dependent exoDNAse (exonuclease V) beta subunit